MNTNLEPTCPNCADCDCENAQVRGVTLIDWLKKRVFVMAAREGYERAINSSKFDEVAAYMSAAQLMLFKAELSSMSTN